MLNTELMSMSVSALRNHYRNGQITPRTLILSLLDEARRAQQHEQNPVWLHLLSADEMEPYLVWLESRKNVIEELPLYGVPFAIKDNIDLAGIPTTAACPEFTYTPEHSAFVVGRLLAAGAIPLGKTNLDQFATGLVGVRSPYGACRNALNPEYISGGSSSGSAVAVAKQWVSFALGTDTAGSGRVPAALNHLVGLKPTRGLLSNRGLVPACRSLDCISIFASNMEDANGVFDVVAEFDSEDSFARANPYSNGHRYGMQSLQPFVVGVPRASQLAFFGDEESERLFKVAIEAARNSGAQIHEIDFQPFVDAARLLYEGPWVAERYIAVQALIERNPEALLPVTREIISAGIAPSAVDAFKSQYLLQSCKQQALAVLAEVDCVMTPTIGTEYTRSEVEADPIQLNSNLGYYTNFMNLLDCAAVAVPTGIKRSGVGFGVTLFHRAFSDKRLMAYGNRLLRQLEPASGPKTTASRCDTPLLAPAATVDIVVCGAHLDGLPLNWQLRERGAQQLQATTTAPKYRFYALPGNAVARPGLLRDEEQGQAIEVEVWRMPMEQFGSFVAEIPAPLAIGKIELSGGDWCTGFVCEPYALVGATEITRLRGWRGYLKQLEPDRMKI